MKLKELGERRIIDSIFKSFSMSQEKDDCALIDMGDEYILMSTDIIRQSTHVPAGASPRQIGKFAAAINLSDIAAMAGQPLGLLVSYLVDPETEDNYFKEVVGGIHDVLRANDAELLGGDTKEGNELVISGTAVGKQKKPLTRKRSHIAKGQIIGVTNTLGRVASGYIYYRTGYQKARGVSMMLDIHPRLREGQIISEFGGKFMMDLSDGIYSSISQMKADYGVGFKIVEDELPQNSSVKKAASLSGASPTDIMCAYGGDYELMFSIDNNHYKDFMAAMEGEKIKVSFIGEAWEGDNLLYNGSHWSKITSRGYEHFSEAPRLGSIL